MKNLNLKDLKEKIFNKKNLPILICVMCMGLSVTLAACSMEHDSDPKAETKSNEYDDVKSAVQKAKTTENTKVTFKRYYTKTQSIKEKTSMIDSDKIGLGEEEFGAKYESYTIESFSADNVVLIKDIDSYPKGYYKITALKDNEDEFIAVYEYDNDGKEKLIEVTETPLELLDSDTIKEIKEGIVVEGKDKLYTVLQNYAE